MTNTRLLGIGLIVGVGFALGCSGAEENPFIGPYGATANTRQDGGGGAGGGGGGGGSADDSGATTPEDSGTMTGPQDSGQKQTPQDSGMLATGGPTWTQIYANSFGPGTLGTCGSSGCHATTRRSFSCSSQSDCYANFQNYSGGFARLITPSSMLWWFNSSGNMPISGTPPSQQSLDALTAWVNAGAPNN